MKYFMIQEAPESKYAPKLENWHNEIDIRDIGMKTYPELPEMQLFTVTPSERTIFTDIVLFPFLLVSPKVMEVIRMYRERCFYTDVILLDQVSGKSELYHLPVFDETDKLVIGEAQGGKSGSIHDIGKHIFWVCDSSKKHTVISLDLAESLLRREVTGLGIKEITLYMKDEERA